MELNIKQITIQFKYMYHFINIKKEQYRSTVILIQIIKTTLTITAFYRCTRCIMHSIQKQLNLMLLTALIQTE